MEWTVELATKSNIAKLLKDLRAQKHYLLWQLECAIKEKYPDGGRLTQKYGTVLRHRLRNAIEDIDLVLDLTKSIAEGKFSISANGLESLNKMLHNINYATQRRCPTRSGRTRPQ
jgi:hypothetical protein